MNTNTIIGPFSSIDNRAVIIAHHGLARRPYIAPYWRRVAGVALQFKCARWRLRQSRRSFTGSVFCCAFRDEKTTDAFAARYAAITGVPIQVRKFAGGLYAASVPVAVAPSTRLAPLPDRLPHGHFVHANKTTSRGHFTVA